jgi:Holliday junction resolvasome RuvABC endonuclease subunit
MSAKLSLGIDPGWKNLGIALIKRDDENKVSVVKTGVLTPYLYETIWDTPYHIEDWLKDTGFKPFEITAVGIERFVSYNNVDSAEQEHILLTIGAVAGHLSRACGLASGYVNMYRAFEWKVNLNKYLVKTKKFSNPSTSFDKVFSVAAAKACLDYDYNFKTDHEGDASAIAYYTMVQSED